MNTNKNNSLTCSNINGLDAIGAAKMVTAFETPIGAAYVSVDACMCSVGVMTGVYSTVGAFPRWNPCPVKGTSHDSAVTIAKTYGCKDYDTETDPKSCEILENAVAQGLIAAVDLAASNGCRELILHWDVEDLPLERAQYALNQAAWRNGGQVKVIFLPVVLQDEDAKAILNEAAQSRHPVPAVRYVRDAQRGMEYAREQLELTWDFAGNYLKK